MRLGVLLPNWVGDVAMATPTLRALRSHFPAGRVVGIARPYLIPLLDGTSWLDRVIPWEHKGSGRLARTCRAIAQTHAEDLDVLITLRATLSAGLFARLTRAKKTIGYARRGLGWLLTDPVQLPRDHATAPASTVDHYLSLLASLGIEAASKQLELATTQLNEAAADGIWKRLALPPGERIMLLNLGSASAGARRWPPEYGVSLALRAADEFGLTTLVLCGPQERDAARALELAANHPQVRSLADEDVSFGTTKALIRRCRLMVTTDSGPRHIAAAMGTPTILLAGPIDPRLSHNYAPGNIELSVPLDCRPCGRSTCPLGHHRCLRDLTVDQVLQAVEQTLKNSETQNALPEHWLLATGNWPLTRHYSPLTKHSNAPMPRLTVLIPCKNEIQHIRACIDSVRPIADEILVADSGSTDGSLEAVRALGDCRIIEREYVNSANFKNWAIPQAQHEWVLVVDADERVTPALAGEIKRLIAGGPACDGYSLRRDNFFLGHAIRHSGWSTSRLIRLFRKEVSRYETRRVHANVVVASGKVGQLVHPLAHHTALDLDHFVAKQIRYANWSALDAFDAGKRTTWLRLLTHAPLRFLQLFILRSGWLDGPAGLTVCGLAAWYTFLKDAKLWSLRNVQPANTEAAGPAARRIAA